ncbi:PepSY-associated TM helix domain-containing protein [Pseudomonas delhiensis]|uniref:PepSY-associated TM helix domain-containing protein n=1 Tax=Pseudomonas delhiensis TaxID=366289 RepID=UPI003159AF27
MADPRVSTRAGRHRAWLALHRWLALLFGLPLALLGASSALLELRGPILRWELGAAALSAKPHAASAIALGDAALRERARQAYPRFARILGSAAPRQGFLTSDNALVFGTLVDRPGTAVAMLDPYDGEPRAFFVFDDLWLAKGVALHRSLLLPPAVGSPLLALCGGVLCLSLLSGLYLWWPGRRNWWAAANLRRGSRGTRRLREWHNLCAAWLYLPLLLIALTGAWLALPPGFTTTTPKPLLSALHGRLGLGTAGMAIAFLAGLALPVLYLTGLLLWWRRRPARQALPSTQGNPSHD